MPFKHDIKSKYVLITALKKIVCADDAITDPVQTLLQRVPTLPFSKVTNKIWRTIQDEGLDEEFGVSRQDWSWAKLPISDDLSRGLQQFDSQVVEAFNAFDIALKSRHGKKYTDLIDYDAGQVYVYSAFPDRSTCISFYGNTDALALPLARPLSSNCQRA
jgi:hypothetical protein